VPSFAAAAAALKTELTLPELCQTVILTRTSVRASPMPAGEDLVTLSQSGATLAIHLSVKNLNQIVRDLTPRYGTDCPVIVAWHVSWPDETIIRGTLADIEAKVKKAGLSRTALIFVGRALAEGAASGDSRLYAADHSHTARPKPARH
jgi:precorrin-4/cobalt-precorrin-4 C11-methyltransferase